MTVNFEAVLLPKTATIMDAIRVIDRGGLQLTMVTDENRVLLGTVTDGDVRRGLLRGISLDRPVSEVMNSKANVLEIGLGPDVALERMRRLSVHQLPVVDADGRVVGLELLDHLVAAQDNDPWVVIMAGGLGTRLMPLTENLPKPMIDVGGRPLLETIIRNLEAQNFRKIYLSVNYRSDVIVKHFGNGESLGVSIRYLHEDRRLGTAGALSLIRDRPSGPFIVMNGDLLTSVNLNHLMGFHREQGSVATMCVREYSFQVPYGVVKTDGAQLISVEEKPVCNFFVNAGLYVINPEALDILESGAYLDMTSFFEKLGERHSISAFPLHEYWKDIGHIEDLESAQSEFDGVFKS
jgi:dTDP-glucose pyrophosphorylase